MRGQDPQQPEMFLYASLEDVVPADHPLRPIRAMVDEAPRRLDETFGEIYGEAGRPSIAPERLLRARGADAAVDDPQRAGARSSRCATTCCWRWFLGPGTNEEVGQATVFTKNRDRLLEPDLAGQFFGEIVRQAKQRGWMSSGHFSVDARVVEAWASRKSFRPKRDRSDEDEPKEGGRNREVDYRGQRRRNGTQESVTDPEARLWRKSQTAEARPSWLGHVLGRSGTGGW